MSIESNATDAEPHSWTVVAQVKSYRVVYFTDDLDYQPPMDGDWYYVSPYSGALPKGMTLRNCWRWRFNGMDFVDTEVAKPADRPASLLRNNKQALLDLLHKRIDALRQSYEPSSLGGGELRARKLVEANLVLQGTEGTDVPLLTDAAAAHHCTVEEMARRVVELDTQRVAVLVDTERQREAIAAAVHAATSQKELHGLRQRIVDKVAADVVSLPQFQPEHTTPVQFNKQLDAAQLTRERLRLRVELRNRINDLRGPLVSQYALDDVVLARKAELAMACQRAGGTVPPGLDATLLISHAAARGQTLAEALQEVLDETRQIRSALLISEQMKDVMLSRIAGVATVGDVQSAGHAIQRLVIERSIQVDQET